MIKQETWIGSIKTFLNFFGFSTPIDIVTLMRKYKNHIPITEEMYQTLDAHKDRTGIAGRALFKHMQLNNLLKPKHNITVQRIESWFARIAKMTDAEDFKTVLTAYESIDDADGNSIIPRCDTQRVLVDDKLLEKLNQIFAIRPNFSRKGFLLRNNAPTGLSDAKLGLILSGKAKTIPVAHKDFFDKLVSFTD